MEKIKQALMDIDLLKREGCRSQQGKNSFFSPVSLLVEGFNQLIDLGFRLHKGEKDNDERTSAKFGIE